MEGEDKISKDMIGMVEAEEVHQEEAWETIEILIDFKVIIVDIEIKKGISLNLDLDQGLDLDHYQDLRRETETEIEKDKVLEDIGMIVFNTKGKI